ncbi:MAG: cytochrome-c oxidase, cbb3-type subunit III [Alphaproteobacteria bacterium]|nr:MAG: cytochrome-c oxidase, cbb3-type subunit III [Alphaproteobacteria bacterium]
MSNKTTEKKSEAGYGTTGHSWDGIEEWNNPLPRWWLWTFYATVIWGLIYTILYPAWPLVHRATPGLLGYSTRAEVEEQIAAFKARNAALEEKLAHADLTKIKDDPDLYNYAIRSGAAVFRNNCSQCHGAGAAGAKGYPNLLDDDWLWGGTIEDIAYTVRNGVRNEQSPDARWSEMPAFGRDGILSEEEIASVVQYVLKISGQPHDEARAAAGEEVFLDNCAGCHGEDGKGDPSVGAPNLTDAIWLYGGDEATITETVTNARFGVMPAWSQEYRSAGGLTDSQINAVATYVHQLGGGQ